MDKDHLFDIPASTRPSFSSHSDEQLYQTLEKTGIPFWSSDAKSITLSLKNKDNKIVWTTTLEGQKGFNEYRWDLIVKREKSNLPYFVHYDRFVEAGNYTDGVLILFCHFKNMINGRITKISNAFEIHFVEGIRACFENGVNHNDTIKGKRLI